MFNVRNNIENKNEIKDENKKYINTSNNVNNNNNININKNYDNKNNNEDGHVYVKKDKESYLHEMLGDWYTKQKNEEKEILAKLNKNNKIEQKEEILSDTDIEYNSNDEHYYNYIQTNGKWLGDEKVEEIKQKNKQRKRRAKKRREKIEKLKDKNNLIKSITNDTTVKEEMLIKVEEEFNIKRVNIWEKNG